MSKARVEAFSDAVIAVAITLLALDLHVPDPAGPGSLAHVRQAVLRRNAIGLLPYAVATLGGIVSPFLTLAICAGVAVFYALPRTTSDVQPQRDA